MGRSPRNAAPGVFLPLAAELNSEPALLRWAGLRDVVWRDGEVRWACAIAPPRALAGHGHQDHAMLVVVSDEVGASAELLHVVALRIGDLLRQGVADPRLDAFESVLQIGVQGLTVPTELGGTLPCRVFTVVAHRDSLPTGTLVHHLLPVLVRWADDPAAMVVPSRFWDPRWREAWETGFVPPANPRRADPSRAAAARRLESQAFWLYRLAIGALALVPMGLVLLPILSGVLLMSIFGTLLAFHPALLTVLPVLVGTVLLAAGVAAGAIASRRSPPLAGVGLGGEPLAADEAPKLWALIREVETALDVTPVDDVVLDRSFDVRVQDCTPAYPLARPRTVLVVGMPLLLSVSPAHLRALLFHALCDGKPGWRSVRRHFSRHRGWVVGWRRNQTGRDLDRLAGRWIRAYADLFFDFGAPMARRATLYADRVAAGHCTAEGFADAIIRAHVLQGWWLTRWDKSSFQGAAASGPVPRPLARWRARGPELNATMARLALTAALRGSHSSIYPISPGERVKALGLRGRLLGDPGALAGSLLGGATLRMIDHVDDLFAVHFGETWRRSRHAAMRAHRRRDALASLPAARRSLFQHLELVELCGKLDEPFLAAQHGIEVASFFPRQAEAQLAAGVALLDVGDEQGLGCLRAAIQLDSGKAPQACAAAMRFLQARDMRAEMEAWGELWNGSRGSLSTDTVRETPAIVVQALAATSSG